jgi:hypothetical protein
MNKITKKPNGGVIFLLLSLACTAVAGIFTSLETKRDVDDAVETKILEMKEKGEI